MKLRIWCLILLAAALLTLSGCACQHDWTEADCVTPKTCKSCQATEGEALGHTWTDADCVTAKTCSVCAATEGEPLGHTPGEVQQTLDAVNCQLLEQTCCTGCNEVLSSNTVTVDSFLGDDLFQFTAIELLTRMQNAARMCDDDLLYNYVKFPDRGAAELDYKGEMALIQFANREGKSIDLKRFDEREIWGVYITFAGEPSEMIRYYFYMAIDPTIKDKEAAMKLDNQIQDLMYFMQLPDFPKGTDMFLIHNGLVFFVRNRTEENGKSQWILGVLSTEPA